MNYIEEELTLAEFSKRFLHYDDFNTPNILEVDDLNIEVLTRDDDGNDVYKQITKFVVKPESNNTYTDGKLYGTADHRIIEDGKIIHLKDHPDFRKIDCPMKVVDIEVDELHSYLANGRLNHNTTAGGLLAA